MMSRMLSHHQLLQTMVLRMFLLNKEIAVPKELPLNMEMEVAEELPLNIGIEATQVLPLYRETDILKELPFSIGMEVAKELSLNMRMEAAKELPLNMEVKVTMEPRQGDTETRRGDKRRKKSRNYATLRMCTKPQVRSSKMPVVYFITLTG